MKQRDGSLDPNNRTWPTPPLPYDAEAHKPRRTSTGAQSPSPDDTVVEVAFPSSNDMHLSCNTDIYSNILVRTKDYSRKQSILEGLHRNKIPSCLLLFMLTRHQPIDGRRHALPPKRCQKGSIQLRSLAS